MIPQVFSRPASRAGKRSRAKGGTASRLFVVLAACLTALGQPFPAAAQGGGDPYARLRPLFGFGQPRAAPQRHPAVRPFERKPAAKPKASPLRKASSAARARSKARPAPPLEAPSAKPPPKAADARTVLVVGDAFGQSLAGGLADAFENEPTVRVEDGAQASASLLRDDPATLLPPSLETAPAAVVVLLGGNDRRSLRGASGRLPLRSAAWTAAYDGRAAALARAVASRGVPLLWVGLPPVASGKAAADYLAFNETFRPAVEGAGGTFIDVWDGFTSESGGFVRFGPDIDGQNARLRAKDGIGFTAAGRRKLAFFVKRPLAKLLDLPFDPDPAAPGTGSPGAEAASLDRDKPMPLSGYLLRPGEDGRLLGGPADIGPVPPGEVPFDPPAVAGRADNFQAAPGARSAD